MTNTFYKKNCEKICILTSFQDIFELNFETCQICKLDKYLIRIFKIVESDHIFKNIIFITCEISFYIYIKQHIELLDDKNTINFFISYPCHLSFSIFKTNDKVHVVFKDVNEYMCKLIGLILQNLPNNTNILTIDYIVFRRCIGKMNNLPCLLELIQIKKHFLDVKNNVLTKIKLPHNCKIEFIK